MQRPQARTGLLATSLNVRLQPTGKATRQDVISKVNRGLWIYPAAFLAEADERARGEGDRRDDLLDGPKVSGEVPGDGEAGPESANDVEPPSQG